MGPFGHATSEPGDAGDGGDTTPEPGSEATGPVGDGDQSDGGEAKFDIGAAADLGGVPGQGCQYLDVAFVIDVSGSMLEERENLIANFPNFVQVLDDYVNDPSSGALGYRVGVTNSSFQEDGSTTGLNGALDNTGGIFGDDPCGTNGKRWLDGPAPGIAANFSCLASRPAACTNVCADNGRERALDAIVGFVDKQAPGDVNEGFYRGEDSLLVVVTLTDDDDKSNVSPAGAIAALDAFAKGEDRYVVVTVAGPANTGCTSDFGEAYAAPRLHEFTTAASKGMMGDICQGDLTDALQDALSLITISCDTLPPPAG